MPRVARKTTEIYPSVTMATDGTLIIIGSGALDEPWVPVIEGIVAAGHDMVRTPDSANFDLARTVYVGRQLATYDDADSEVLKHRNMFREELSRLKLEVTAALVAAEQCGRLRTRREFEDVIYHIRSTGSPRIGVVTTNWDLAVETALKRIDERFTVHYLHGSIRSSGAIYLPSEMVDEPYRNEAEKTELVDIRSDVVHAIDGASRIVLYGISVSPLDAELGQVLASGMQSSSVSEVLIVDPCFENVGERVLSLLDKNSSKVQVFGQRPTRLGEKIPFWVPSSGQRLFASE